MHLLRESKGSNNHVHWPSEPRALDASLRRRDVIPAASRSAHCLIKIGNDVGNILDTDGQAHDVCTGTGLFKLFRREL